MYFEPEGGVWTDLPPALGCCFLLTTRGVALFLLCHWWWQLGARERALFLSPGFFPAGFRVYVARSARQTLRVQVGAGFHGINHFVFYSMTRAHLPMVTGRPCPRLIDSVPAGKNKVTTDTAPGGSHHG